MRKAFLAAAVLIGGSGWIPSPASACGDKFLVIGRGVKRVPKASHPAAILLYLRPGSPLPAAASAMKLEATLKRAGHSVELLAEATPLSEWLGTHRYDLVLTDLEEARSAARAAAAATSEPVVIPVAVKPSKATRVAAESEFSLLIEAPTKSLSFLSKIDRLMASKARKLSSR